MQLKTSLIQSKNISMICLINVNGMIEWSNKPPINLTTVQVSIIGGSCHKYHFSRDTSFCDNKHVFVMKKQVFCHDKCRLVMINLLSRQNMCLSWQKLSRQAYFCHDKWRVLLWQTQCLLQRKYACRDKSFVVTKLRVSRQIFVVTKNLSRQKIFGLHKHHFFGNKTSVKTSILLLWQRTCFVMTNMC